MNFATGKAELTPESQAILDGVAESLVANEEIKVQVGGHTDNTGSAAVNKRLSAARAETVRAYLESKGVAADRLTARGYGPSKPVASNRTAEGRAQNRRVELTRDRTEDGEDGEDGEGTERGRTERGSGPFPSFQPLRPLSVFSVLSVVSAIQMALTTASASSSSCRYSARYIRISSKKYEIASGPISRPSRPNQLMPANAPITVMNGWIRAQRRNTNGRITLSTLPTTNTPQMRQRDRRAVPSRQGQGRGARPPDEAAADHGQDRHDDGDHAPEHRVGQPRGPERDPDQQALHRGRESGTDQGRERHVAEAGRRISALAERTG